MQTTGPILGHPYPILHQELSNDKSISQWNHCHAVKELLQKKELFIVFSNDWPVTTSFAGSVWYGWRLLPGQMRPYTEQKRQTQGKVQETAMIMQQTLTQLNISPEHDQTIIEHFQQEQPWGLATAIDLQGCNPLLIRSADYIRTFVDALCTLIDMKKFGPTTIVHFGEDPRVSGYSMTQLIETSLISGHFANSSNAAYIDIFSCKAYRPSVAAAFAKKVFEAEDMRVTITFRK